LPGSDDERTTECVESAGVDRHSSSADDVDTGGGDMGERVTASNCAVRSRTTLRLERWSIRRGGRLGRMGGGGSEADAFNGE
jgi:hypothetical protein